MRIKRRTITNQLEDIKSEMCDKYCKYPNYYHELVLRDMIQDDTEAHEKMLQDICPECPLTRL